MDEIKPVGPSNGKVMDYKEGKRKKIRAETGPVKLRAAEVQASIADAISGAKQSLLPSFPLRLGVISPERGVRLPILVSTDGLVEVVRLEFVRDEILDYCKDILAGMPEYLVTPRQAAEAAQFWLSTAQVTPETFIKSVRWADEGGMTYRRMPWNLGAPEWTPTKRPAPTWEALLSRMSNNQAFIDWIGSLFVEESSLQNYVWIYGDGGDGKGSINRFLERVFGKAYRSKQPPGKGDKFWTYGLLGARLVVMPDCDDSRFVSSGIFKSLTGGDPVDVEAKGQMSFTAKLNAKYLVLSQEKPQLSSRNADLRRIIYCELGKAPGIDEDFEDKLWQEGGDFLSTCVRQYEAKYHSHGPIKTDDTQTKDLVSTLEEADEVIFEKWFRLNPEKFVVPGDMQRVLETEFPRRRMAQHAFRAWMERTHGVRKKVVRVSKDVLQKRYGGLEMIRSPSAYDKPTFEIEDL